VPEDIKRLLVFSPQPEFSEWLRLSLEETGHYRVDLCNAASELADLLAQPTFDIIIVDFPGSDTDLGEILEHFTQHFPGIPLLLFPPENDPYHPEVASISAWAYLPKPFYLPDLLLAVETLSKGEKILPPPPQMPHALEALQQQLQSFVEQESVLAAWVFSAGRLLTRVESLESPSFQDLLGWVEQRWQRLLSDGEWLRYWKSASPGDALLIYATTLIPQTLLLIAVAASLPPALARAKGRTLATTLKTSPWLASELLLAEAQTPSIETLPTEEMASSHDLESSDDTLVNILDEEAWLSGEGEEEETSAPDLSLLEQWLSEAPPPNPPHASPEERTTIQPDWQPETTFAPEDSLFPTASTFLESNGGAEATPTWEFGTGDVEFEATEEAHMGVFEPPADFLEALAAATESLPSSPPNPVPPTGDETETSSLPLSVEDTQPIPLRRLVSSAEAKDLLLTYTAVLVTSSPNALQNPRATTELTRWMPRWCQRLGWTLKRLVITPNYLLWTITVPSSTPPHHMVQAIRHYSAWRLFHRIGEGLGDMTPEAFWAPAHLALAGESPPSNTEIDALISRNRSNP
jgi:DNA-binding NarL/FixJ family response regulator